MTDVSILWSDTSDDQPKTKGTLITVSFTPIDKRDTDCVANHLIQWIEDRFDSDDFKYGYRKVIPSSKKLFIKGDPKPFNVICSHYPVIIFKDQFAANLFRVQWRRYVRSLETVDDFHSIKLNTPTRGNNPKWSKWEATASNT